MEYRITDQPYPRGEICMWGPLMFEGYYKRADKTAECHDSEGWFTTGDVAMVYPNGSIKIIDRSKNIFKLSQGEYIAPEKIENIFVLCPTVAQSFVYGDSLKNNIVAVVVPEITVAEDWCRKNKIEFNFEQVCQNEDFKKVIFDEILKSATDHKLSSLEKPKEISLYHEQFSVENDLLTPTFKLKRNIAQKFFQAQIEEMYAKVEAKEKGRS